MHGIELANAYTELNDPRLQEELFAKQLAGLPDEESMAKKDDDFVRALKHGMPPAGGMGLWHRSVVHDPAQPIQHSRRHLVSALASGNVALDRNPRRESRKCINICFAGGT